MTVMAAEAAAGSAGGGAAATRAGAGAAGASRSARTAPTPARKQTPAKQTAAKRAPAKQTAAKRAPAKAGQKRSPRKVPDKPAAARAGRRPPPTAMRRQGESGQAWLQRQSEAPPPTAEIIPGDSGRYRRIVVAEFAATVVLVGATPFLKPRKQAQTPEQFAAEFTLAQPLVRLSAVCIVFFVLALLANGPRTGKLAAAFGGLVLAGTALNATTALQGVSAIFSRGAATGTTSADIGAQVGAGAETGTVAAGPDETPVKGAF